MNSRSNTTETLIANRYRIVERLSVAGFGIVYKAYDEENQKNVALKEIKPDLAVHRDYINMFKDEAMLTTKLDHPNIVQVMDLITEEDRFYILMGYIEGKNLRQLHHECQKPGRSLPLGARLYIIVEVCRALYYAHNKQHDKTGEPLDIVHRDISPSNIMITYDGIVKVIDFGIAKARAHFRTTETTQQGLTKGKIEYMSPQQVDGLELDHRSDLFSLGIVMFEMLTNHKLFSHEKSRELQNLIAEARVDPAMFDQYGVPRELRTIILKAVKKDVGERYQSAREMGNDINAYLRRTGQTQGHEQLRDLMQQLFPGRREDPVPQFKPDEKDITPITPPHDETIIHKDKGNDDDDSQSSKESERKPPEKVPTPPDKPEPPRQEPRSKNYKLTALLAVLSLAVIWILWWTLIRESEQSINSAQINPPPPEPPQPPSPRAKFRFESKPPGATVVLNGTPLAEATPCEASRDLNEELNVVFKLAGFDSIAGLTFRGSDQNPQIKDGKLWTYQKPPDSSGTRVVAGTFYRNVRINSVPTNATIYVGDDSLGLANQKRVRLLVGDYEVRLHKDGYIDAKFRLTVNAKTDVVNEVLFRTLRVTVRDSQSKNSTLAAEIINVTDGNDKPITFRANQVEKRMGIQSEVREPIPTSATLILKCVGHKIKVAKRAYLDKVVDVNPTVTGEITVTLQRQPQGFVVGLFDETTRKPIFSGEIFYRKEGEQSASISRFPHRFGQVDAYGSHSQPLTPGQYQFQATSQGYSRISWPINPIDVAGRAGEYLQVYLPREKK